MNVLILRVCIALKELIRTYVPALVWAQCYVWGIVSALVIIQRPLTPQEILQVIFMFGLSVVFAAHLSAKVKRTLPQ